MLKIGIDTGVNTGFAVWDDAQKKFTEISCMKIHQAMQRVNEMSFSDDISVFFEDARLRNWFGNAGREQLQGAGSVKRDCGIWDDFLRDLGVPYTPVAPKHNATKMNADFFAKITGWKGRTNEHSRDAAMLVFNR